jgi:hypothetical protein
MKAVTVATFNSKAEAESLVTRLTLSGINAEIRSDSNSEKVLDFSRPNAGVRIQVPRAQFEAALRLVYDWNVNEQYVPPRGGAPAPNPINWSAPN